MTPTDTTTGATRLRDRSVRLQRLWKSTKENPGYVAMRTLARFGWIRRAVSSTRGLIHRSKTRQLVLAAQEALASSRVRLDEGVTADIFVQRLRTDGVSLGLKLRDEDVQSIHAHTLNYPCFADRCTTSGFYNAQHAQACRVLNKQILVAQYFNTGAQSNAIARLINDPLLRLIASRYLGSEPCFVGANLWWTYPVQPSAADRAEHAHLFHRDVDDFRFMKFFFYLTDVQPGDGAHVCVRRSHHSPPVSKQLDRWLIRRYSDLEIKSAYSPQDILEITGQAGVGFAENTLCVHKGLTPQHKPRLLLQLQFALFDYGALHDMRSPGELELLDV
jgi:hypothetical protein